MAWRLLVFAFNGAILKRGQLWVFYELKLISWVFANVLKASFYRQELAHGKYSARVAVTKWMLYVAFVYGMACTGMYASGEHQTKHGIGPNPMPKSS